MKIRGKHFRTLAGTAFTIDAIYNSYRQGWNEGLKKMETFVKDESGEWKRKERESDGFILKDGEPDFKLHKKVYDVEISIEKEKEFDFKGEKKSDNKLNATISAWLLGEMIKATVAFGKEIPQNNGRDAYDWEEGFISDLKGRSIIFAVTGEGIGTKYTFKEAPKPVDKGPDGDLPF